MTTTTAMESPWVYRQNWHEVRLRKRAGSLTDRARETYLRDDVPCGHPACNVCKRTRMQLSNSATHLLLPDASSLETYLEVFQLPNIHSMVLLTSAICKVGTKGNMRKAAKIRELYKDVRRQCVLFDDLHCICTAHISCRSNSKAQMLRAANYYFQHLDGKIPVVVLSEDPDQQSTNSNTNPTQQAQQGISQASDAQTPAKNGEELLDSLLEDKSSPMFDLSALQAALLPAAPDLKGVQVMTPKQYFSKYWGHEAVVWDLFESIEQTQLQGASDASSNRTPGAYARHLSATALVQGLNSGEIVQGVVRMSKRSSQEATVQLGSQGTSLMRQVVIKGKAALNRAMHGDTVAVRVLPQSHQQEAVAAAAEEEDGFLEDIDAEAPAPQESAPCLQPEVSGHSEGLQEKKTRGAKGVPMGEVVAVVGRSNQDIVVSLAEEDQKAMQHRQSSTRSEAVLCVPTDRRLPKLRVRSSHMGRLIGQRFVVRCTGWDRSSMYPSAHVLRVLGPLNDLRAETDAVLVNAGVAWQPFSDLAMAELPQVASPEDWQLSEQDAKSRRDLRGSEYFICSIDPPGCTDVDDALSARWLPNGQLEVGVHIADVSHFVTQGGLLDGEAYARGTTVYLQDRRLDMLPSLLSEHLCSLRAGVDRCAVSVLWTLTADYSVDSIWFGRSLIRSKYQLTYQQAQDMLEGKPPTTGPRDMQVDPRDHAELQESLKLLTDLTDHLRAVRQQNGALEFEGAELKFDAGADGKPERVEGKAQLPMMAVIAEMMIFANAAVAHCIARAFPGAALLRRHPAPRSEAFDQVKELLDAAGTQVDVSSNKALAAWLETACAAAPQAAPLIRALTVRAMSEAEYCSTGDIRPGGGGVSHFGLALSEYTHFTSPIRRYADVVVHRQLLKAIQALPDEATQMGSDIGLASQLAAESAGVMSNGAGQRGNVMMHSELTTAAEIMNERHRAAKRAQKECSDLYLLLLLHREPHIEAAVVYAVRPTSLLVFVPKFHLKGTVHLADRAGLVLLPLTGPQQDQPQNDPFEISHRRQFRLQTDDAEASITDSNTGKAIFHVVTMSNIWVQLSASGSTAHGPALHIRLVSPQHPQVDARAQTSKASSSRQAGSTHTAQLQPNKRSTAALQMEKHDRDMHGQVTADRFLEAIHQRADASDTGTSIKEAVGMRHNDRPQAARHQHRRDLLAQPSSIAAVLASSQLLNDDQASLRQEADGACADIKQSMWGQGCQQLISHSILPSVSQSCSDGTQVQTLWKAQVKLGRLAARLNASFVSSNRMHRLQEKFQSVTLQVAELQQGLLC